MEMSQRKQNILTAIVEEYIRTGDPVSSKVLAEKSGLGVSSATIRNEMAELFSLGYLEQPHTSAGRIPSQRGIRLYLDFLMPDDEPDAENRAFADSLFHVRAVDMDSLLEEMSDAVSQMTGCTVVTTAPTPAKERIDHVDAVKIAPFNVVTVIVTESGEVYSRSFRLGYDMTAGAMEFFGGWLTERVKGKTLESMTQSFMQETAMQAGENILLFTPLLAAVYELVCGLLKPVRHVCGQTKLFSYGELKPTALDILKMLDDDDAMREVLSGERNGVRLGHESRRSELADAGVIVQRYRLPNGSGGVIGVIGPVRQNYRKILPVLKYFADNLGRIFDEPQDDNDNVTEIFRPRAKLSGGFADR